MRRHQRVKSLYSSLVVEGGEVNLPVVVAAAVVVASKKQYERTAVGVGKSECFALHA